MKIEKPKLSEKENITPNEEKLKKEIPRVEELSRRAGPMSVEPEIEPEEKEPLLKE